MNIKPIKRTSISEQVFEQLKQNIIDGVWAQGEKLPSENELADSFNVSRVTIRHAIHKLAALGLVETKLGEGTFIKTLHPGTLMHGMIPAIYLNPRDIMEVLDFRYVLEIETVGMAVDRCVPEDVDLLKKQLQTMQTSKNDYWSFSNADLDFHMLIARITRNSLIVETYSILRDVLEACMKETVESLGAEIGIPYHEKLIFAFEKKEANDAKEIMRAHMDSTRNEFQRALEQLGKL